MPALPLPPQCCLRIIFFSPEQPSIYTIPTVVNIEGGKREHCPAQQLCLRLWLWCSSRACIIPNYLISFALSWGYRKVELRNYRTWTDRDRRIPIRPSTSFHFQMRDWDWKLSLSWWKSYSIVDRRWTDSSRSYWPYSAYLMTTRIIHRKLQN